MKANLSHCVCSMSTVVMCDAYQLVDVVSHRYFDRGSLLAIFLSSLSLAAMDATDRDCLTTRCQILSVVDIVFTGVFTAEMLLKV